MERLARLSRSWRPARRLCALAIVCVAALCAARPASALDPRVHITQFHTVSYQIENGLPQNSVQAVIQSRDGYLWLGTQAGLVRFDGVRFTVFDRASVPEFRRENVRALAEDKAGTLWIATDAGLLSYRNGRFGWLGTQNGLPSDQVRSLLVDKDGILWIGTTNGVCRLKDGRLLQPAILPGTGDFSAVRIYQSRDGSIWFSSAVGLYQYIDGRLERFGVQQGLPDDGVYDVYEDRRGVMWVGTSRGLARIEGRRAVRVPIPADDSVHAIWEDREGSMWLGLERRGIVRLHNGEAEVYGKAEGLAGNYVMGFLEDQQGNVWVALFDSGLTCLRQTPFAGFGLREGLPTDDVQAILQTKSGDMWMGTNGAGLARLSGGRVTTFTSKQGLPDDAIMTLAEDAAGVLWVGTPRGLCKIVGGRVVGIPDPDRVLQSGIRSLVAAPDGPLWIGTNAGLCALQGGRLLSVSPTGDAISPAIQAMLIDRAGALWLAGNRGLTRVKDGVAKTYTTADGLAENYILSLYEDRDGVVWAGTFGGGLSRVKDGIKSVTAREGLFDNAAFAILEDEFGYLWMSSNRGIFKVLKADVNDWADGSKTRVRSTGYAVADGLRGTEGNGGSQPAAWKMQDGRLWFAGIRGFAIVDARPVAVGGPVARLERMFYGRSQIDPVIDTVLPPGSGELTFEYTALDYRSPQGIQFRYRLDPFNPDWVEPGERRTAFYTNVPPGSYVFRVSARNKDGSWSEAPATLSFRIRPHYYQASWFYALCGLALLLAGATVYGLRDRAMKARQRTLARLVDERTTELRAEVEGRRQAQARLEREVVERQQVQEELARAMTRAEAANQAKGMFLANMSHEIRTPMNGILGMTELLIDTPMSDDQREQLGMVRSSAHSLLTVINDVLDFSKIDAGRMELETISFNVRDFVRETVKPFSTLAADKRLDLRWSVDDAVPAVVVGDPGRIRQVVVNLLGNAIKFTESGSVSLAFREAGRQIGSTMLSVQVRDTGIGIPPNKIKAVFEPFTQADGSTTRRYGGTGLGLTITSQIVKLMGGEIKIESEEGKGTVFAFTVKLGLPPAGEPVTAGQPPLLQPGLAADATRRLRVLVAEDNAVNQRLIGRLLEKWGHDVTIVASGEQAVDATARRLFDLVLMDVQMPGMDGFEATQAIRARERATGSKLTIIAITAHAMKGDRERCLDAGMDGYVSKPVEAAELQKTIATMLATR